MRRLAAALLLVLLPFGVSGEGANAQSNTTDAEIVGTITNIAEASWRLNGVEAQTASNEVTFDITLPPPEIRTLRPVLNGGFALDFRAPLCSASGQSSQGSGGSTATEVPITPREGGFEATTTLRAYMVTRTGGTPQAHDHRALRWVRADGLHELAWVPADRAWLPELERALHCSAGAPNQ